MKSLPFLVIVVVASLLIGQVPPVDISDGGIGLKGYFVWDAVTVDIKGNPEIVAFYRIYCYRAQDDPRVNPSAVPIWTAETSECTYPMAVAWTTMQAAGVKEGERLRFLTRAIDSAGNEGGFSNSWEGFLDVSQPASPSHFRAIVK